MNRPIIWESPYLTYGYDYYSNSIYNSLKQQLSTNDRKHVSCGNEIYSNVNNDDYLFIQHMPKTNSKYISDELYSSKNEIPSVMDGHVPIEHNLKHSEIGSPVVVSTRDDSQKTNDEYRAQCDKYEINEEKRERLLADSHVDGDSSEVNDDINTSYSIHDKKDSTQKCVPMSCAQSLDDELDDNTPHNIVDLGYTTKKQINENCNTYDNKTCTTSSNTSVYTENDGKETSSIDFNKHLYTDPHNYTTYMQNTLYDNWPSVNNIDVQFNSTIATPIWENAWVGSEYQTDYMHSNLVKDKPTQLHDQLKTTPYISPEMYVTGHTYGIPYIYESKTRNCRFLDNYSPSKVYKKPYFGVEGIAGINSNNCSPMDILEKNGYDTNFNLYGLPNQFQRVPTIKTDFTYYDNSKNINNDEDILGAVYKGCTNEIDITNIDFIGMDDKVWQALRGAGMFKLGNKGRAILKSKISKHLKMHPELRLRASCISGVRRATTRQLFQLAQLCNITSHLK